MIIGTDAFPVANTFAAAPSISLTTFRPQHEQEVSEMLANSWPNEGSVPLGISFVIVYHSYAAESVGWFPRCMCFIG